MGIDSITANDLQSHLYFVRVPLERRRSRLEQIADWHENNNHGAGQRCFGPGRRITPSGCIVTSQLERLALQRGLQIGERSRTVLRMLDDAGAPLSVDDIYRRTRTGRSPISLATIRRTLNQLTAAGLLRRLYSESHTPHYEKIHRAQREALIDSVTGKRLEFHSEGIEGLLKHAVHQLGYRLLDYRLELFGVPKQRGPKHGAPGEESDSADSPTTPTGVAPKNRSRRGPRH